MPTASMTALKRGINAYPVSVIVKTTLATACTQRKYALLRRVSAVSVEALSILLSSERARPLIVLDTRSQKPMLFLLDTLYLSARRCSTKKATR